MRYPVAAVSAGAYKRDAIIGAWRTGFIDELITDEDTAKSLIEFIDNEKKNGNYRLQREVTA